ncbi:MAG TPA: ATP phosphoribosyltransferase regulatory subunit [Pseudomonadales bacterium]|nr:ATP phosphoribosyltransferase regulatory subunit [Pseudomonadales bacterium]
MSIADRWLLPDGIEELLPAQAARAEYLRRQLLDLYSSWGYELVMPPLVEFTESLLVSGNNDLDLQTCKLTDQLSGRLMGVRADITPQTARIDAHGLIRQGATRLCYAGSTLHARPKTALASRSPIQIGCEFYGVAGVEADCEVISLMLETARVAGIQSVTLDLGHVAIFRSLAELAKLDAEQEQVLFDILQRKATTELKAFVTASVTDTVAAELLLAMPNWKGDRNILALANTALAKAPVAVREAITQLEQIAVCVEQRAPDVKLYFDLSELRGYHYHTGVVFALYVAGVGEAIANGGRYDNFGAAFGRARPASGFSADLKHLMDLGSTSEQHPNAIWAVLDGSSAQWQAIAALRAKGERVIASGSGEIRDASCDRELTLVNSQYQIKPLS